jgi:hypothetical protein
VRLLRSAAFAGIALFLACSIPAGASEASVLQVQVRAALRTAKSFVARETVKPNVYVPLGGSADYTVVAPNRFRLVTNSMPDSDDTIIIGNQVYGDEGKGWMVQTWTDSTVSGFEGDLLDFVILSTGADAMVAGKPVGTFTRQDPHGPKPTDTLSCSYDKATFRPIVCSNDLETVTYSRFDDPSVTIPTPDHAMRLDG